MVSTRHLQIEEVVQAFTALGGEAEWNDVEARITEKRGGSYRPYKDWRNYKNMMFQLVQQHCEGYRKFTGTVLFVKVRAGRFRLVTSLPGGVHRTPVEPEEIHPETVPASREYMAGAVRQVLINAYERDPKARRACLERHGTNCVVCGMNFEQRYGPIGRGFIHVHHKKPLATKEIYRLDPVNDLVPVCPNCHAMLHSYDPPWSVEELKETMTKAPAT